MKPRLGRKFLHNLQMQSKFLIILTFCLKISSDWDSLISVGSNCHNFFSNIPDGVYAIQRCLSFGQGKAVAFSSNTCVMKVGFKLCTVLSISVRSSCRFLW